MGETVLSGVTVDDFVEVIEGHGADQRFWSFVASFAATIRFDMEASDAARTARLVVECARQYAYLREEHPDHFKRLAADRNAIGKVWASVAVVAVAADIPEQHFAAAGDLKTVYEVARASHAEREAAEKRKADQIARFQTAVVEMEKNPPVITKPVDGFMIGRKDFTTDEIIGLAKDFYAQSKGRLIKVRDHVLIGGDNFGYQRTSEVFRNYDIAIVDETFYGGDEEHIGLTAPRGKVAESTWPVVMLTGPNRGLKASIAAPDFHADGSVTENDMVLVTLPSFIVPERMSDQELVELVRLDMEDYAERPINVTAATAYLAGTDDQTEAFFDPPLPAVVDPFDPELCDFSSKYRIDDWHRQQGISVIDVFLDIDSTDERTDAYRSMWTHGVSYTSHGLMEVGETTLLPFIPAFVGKKNGDEVESTSSLAH